MNTRRTETYPAKVFVEQWHCPVDGCDGLMQHQAGVALLSKPPKHRHKCSKCDHSENSTTIYPNVQYEFEHR